MAATFKSPDYATADDFARGVCVASCEASIRLGFIRKVYSILSLQLLVTTAIGAAFMTSETLKTFVQASPNLLRFSMYFSLIVMFALMVFRTKHPLNLYLLGLFTLSEGYVIGVIVTLFESATVIQAFILCLTVTLGLTLFTFQTKYDWTVFSSLAMTGLWLLIGVGLLHLFVPFSTTTELLVAVFGAGLFSLFIVIDTQMIMHKLSTDEYILGAINLYLDILNLFLELLRILNAANK